MSDISAPAISPLSFLRRPHFKPDDRRSPMAAVLHALPAFIYLSLNVWLMVMGLVLFISVAVPLPSAITIVLVALASVPCALVTWGLFVRCVEVEATVTIG